MNSLLLRTGIASFAVFWSSFAFTGTVDGQVVGVTDGDTITVLDGQRTQHKVRLAGIDAPDMQVPSKKS